MDELTDCILGALVAAGHVMKIANNIFFGGPSMDDAVDIFRIILNRLNVVSIRMKPKKIQFNIRSADILGMVWKLGKIAASND